jgi:hypothetical protein
MLPKLTSGTYDKEMDFMIMYILNNRNGRYCGIWLILHTVGIIVVSLIL